ncbi:MAG: IPT/TIG domain-containing protein, partial [Candidatus Acidiferrales bacterium]
MHLRKWKPLLILVTFLLSFSYSRQAYAQTPTITELSPTSGPVGTLVTIAGSNFGTTQSNSSVSLNGTTAAVTTWSNTSIVAMVPSGATSGSFSVSVNSQLANSGSFTITPLPSGWSDGDIGTVGVAGSATYANGTFTVSGSGQQIGSTSDGMHFAYQPLSGDGSIVARVVSVQGGYTQAGVMIRETLNANAANAFMFYQSSYIYFSDRTSTGANTSSLGDQRESLSYWVKVVRSGSTFSGYVSSDGVNWVQIGTSQTITMAQNVYVGLAVSGNSTSSLETATFDSVSINSTSSPAPAITSVSPQAGVIGSQALISGSGFGAFQGNSSVRINGAPAIINSWSATSISITIPSGAISGPMIVSVAPSMNASNAFIFLIGTQTLPSWLDVDVGSVGMAG